jgi:hypothetical protein
MCSRVTHITLPWLPVFWAMEPTPWTGSVAADPMAELD